MTTLCILGRQPELGLAELEALYGSEQVRAVGQSCALVDGAVDFARLGGSVKVGTVIDHFDNVNWKKAFQRIAKALPEIVSQLPADGKVKLGASLYGFDAVAYAINGEVLRLKKTLVTVGRSARAVPNETPALSSAQTYHNSLARELGLEFAIATDGKSTFVARVTHVQDIDAYRVRDRERPKRDAFVGMLPPKLAQIIINLAIGKLLVEDDDQIATSHTPHPNSPAIVLDPFCGTGVILQEALLMGYDTYGSDISPKMIDYSRANLNWLREKQPIAGKVQLELADATSHNWNLPKSPTPNFFIACEGYLGQPLGGQQPTEEKMRSIIHDTNNVLRSFLKNIAPQLPKDTRLCLAVPAWYVDNREYHLPVLEELEALGFSQLSFSAGSPLVYRREDQLTARELVVLTKA